MSTVAIIDYGSGNLRSAAKAFERAAREFDVNTHICVTDEPAEVKAADRIVLPGVGAFADCKAGLDAVRGLREALEITVISKQRPFLGICVGMQLMAERSHEHGNHPGLSWIPGNVEPLAPADPSLKVPHMGWNALRLKQPQHPLFSGIAEGDHAYFVHSYHLICEDPAHVLADVEYGQSVAAVVGRANWVGTQFHPEKSQAAGLTFIANFLRWQP